MKYTKADYKKLLARQDWFYFYSDDHSMWSAGKKSMELIQTYQKELDPDYAIWNQFVPEDFKVKAKDQV